MAQLLFSLFIQIHDTIFSWLSSESDLSSFFMGFFPLPTLFLQVQS